jgi:hypothetical protein
MNAEWCGDLALQRIRRMSEFFKYTSSNNRTGGHAWGEYLGPSRQMKSKISCSCVAFGKVGEQLGMEDCLEARNYVEIFEDWEFKGSDL